MTDILAPLQLPGLLTGSILTPTARYRDMGDGSWAQVVTQAAGLAGSAGYPAGGAVAVTNSSGNVAAAAAVATLPGVAGKTTYISGFTITGSGALAASVVLVTVVGITGGTATYVYTVVAGATLANLNLHIDLIPAIPASALNTAIVVTLPSLGTGNTNAAVVARGFQI